MLQQIKSLFNPKEYFNSSIRLLERGGRHGSTNPPFSYRHAVHEFRSWVYAAAMINANAVAATPLRLYARRSVGKKGLWRTRPVNRKRLDYLNGELGGDHAPSRAVMTKIMDLGDDMEEITEMHPVKELLQKANHVYNGFDLTVLRTLYQELTGNAYLHPVMDQQLGVPVELWPMPAQWMQVIPSRDNFIEGYSYGRTDVEALRFEVDEVIHFKRPNPDNLFYGLGKVEAAYGTVQANRAVHEMDLATFENHARPDYAVIVKGPHKRTDLDLFEQHVSERLRGTRKAGQFLAMSGDVNLMPLNFPPKDLSGRDEIVEEIAAVFGVPVSMLKANDPNLASARAGFAQWRESTILPMLRMDEDVLNQILLPMFGIEEDACLAYDNPVPADKEYELRERQAAVAGGWRTANEARKEEGKEEFDDEMADALMVGGLPLGAAAQMGMGMGMGMGMPPMPIGNGAPLPPGPEEEAPALPEAEEAPVQEPEVAQNFALNGAQISSIVEVLQNVASGIISRDAAIEVIVATGVGREQAEAMAVSQQEEAAAPVEAEQIEDKAVEPGDMDLYDTREEAEARARELGCEGAHEHEFEDGTVQYMPCGEMDEYTELTGLAHEKAISDVDLKPTESMANFAERGLKLRQEHGRGGTEVGVARARDLKNRDTLSPETVRRMHSFFSRHRVDLQAPAAKPGHKEYPSAGVIAWLLWGGNPANPDGGGAGWAARKVEELERSSKSYTKAKGDKEQSTPAKPNERVSGSDQNKPGSAANTRGGIEISESQEKALKNKVEEHNEKHGDKKGKKVTLGMLKSVYRRGAGAFSTSHRPGMGRQQWSMARVNAFLHLVRTGSPKNSKYTTDNDLLPKGHPKKGGQSKNCGTGAGGFQAGNDCATGPGSAGSSNGGKASSPKKVNDLARKIREDGGFTYNPMNDSAPTTGFAVSPFKELEMVVDVQKPEGMDVAKYRENIRPKLREYIQKNIELLGREGAHLGGWYDKDNGKVYIDISLVRDSIEDAMKIAKDNDQEAIFNLETFETISAR